MVANQAWLEAQEPGGGSSSSGSEGQSLGPRTPQRHSEGRRTLGEVELSDADSSPGSPRGAVAGSAAAATQEGAAAAELTPGSLGQGLVLQKTLFFSDPEASWAQEWEAAARTRGAALRALDRC